MSTQAIAQVQQTARSIGNNESIFIDSKTLTIAQGTSKNDVTAQIAKLGARDLGPGAIVFRANDKLYMVDTVYALNDRQQSYGGLNDDRQRSYGGLNDDRQRSYGEAQRRPPAPCTAGSTTTASARRAGIQRRPPALVRRTQRRPSALVRRAQRDDRQRSYGGLVDDRQRSYGGLNDDRQQSYGGLNDDRQRSYGGGLNDDRQRLVWRTER